MATPLVLVLSSKRSIRDRLHNILPESQNSGEQHEEDGWIPIVKFIGKIIRPCPGSCYHLAQLDYQARVQHLALCRTRMKRSRVVRDSSHQTTRSLPECFPKKAKSSINILDTTYSFSRTRQAINFSNLLNLTINISIKLIAIYWTIWRLKWIISRSGFKFYKWDSN